MNNMFISYDLHAPDKNYERVINTIKGLGNWARVNKSFWYVSTQFSVGDVKKMVWAAMDRDDSLCVVDATNNAAAWENLDMDVQSMMKTSWNRKF